jgi:Phosphodiester glycosidase
MIGRGGLAALATLLAGGSAAPAVPLTLETPRGPIRLSETTPGVLADGIAWRAGAGGLDWTELRLHGRGEVRRTLIVVARLDPRRFTLSLENGMAPGGFLHVWTLDRAPATAALALNAGMFASDGAWGWVVHGGTEYRPPRAGPLAGTIVIDTAGQVELLDDAGLARVRATEMGRVREAFQSYPVLLHGAGALPEMLRIPSGLIDLSHRDARLALGIDRKGRLLLALTRFDALGPAFGSVPFGMTLPEMALVLRGLGAESAVALDGGISAQLLLRDAAGGTHRWEGLRPVPLGLSATPILPVAER